MTLIELKNISKSYGKITALKEVSIGLEDSEILAILGHNGSGKTTLLRIIACLEREDKGEFLYNGSNVDSIGRDKLRGKITMVFQVPVMFETTIYENIAYGLRLKKANFSEEKVRDVMELAGLKEWKRKASEFSFGEKQRIAFARAIVIEPKVLLLDEPTSNLDPANTKLIEKMIKNCKKNMGIIIATHDIFQAKRLADKVAHIYDGRIIEFASNKEFFEETKDERTKKFLTGEF
ncbi:MAG: phosphate ABC transporter ATP-binding protein [Candidatus Thermoplasmatota archaeon]